ncbi:MAG: choice-of-anchor R domain-containing protein [Anaerolineaceae bacterium]|nr:choice-of-anchor R domain-containing protein [Anaerolineaceae bacterium]
MKLGIFLESPEGQVLPLPWQQASVRSLSWNLAGGPQKALIRAGSEADIESLAGYLGWGMRIFNETHTLVWWGFVEEVSLHDSMGRHCYSLKEMANRVAVSYRSQAPGADFGAKVLSPWVEDLASQSNFGVKELILKAGSMGAEEALILSQRTLAQRVFPREAIVASPVKEKEVLLQGKGWFSTLAWRNYRSTPTVFGNMPAQSGSASFGMSAFCQSLAQSFRPAVGLSVSFVDLRLRKRGSIADSLLVQIQADSQGRPSGNVLASAACSPALISAEAYEWLRLSLGMDLHLEGMTNYWLVLSRAGALSGGEGYTAALDQNLHYPGGVLMRYNQGSSAWENLEPEADLLFKMGGLRSTSAMMHELYAACGQKLKGLILEMDSSAQISCLDDKVEDGQKAMRHLLALGDGALNPLFALVDAQRQLRVFALDSALPSFHYDNHGQLLEKSGSVFEEADSPVGGMLKQGFRHALIRGAIFDPLSRQYCLES